MKLLQIQLDRKKEQYKQLIEELKRVGIAVKAAAKNGDLKENAEFHALKDQERILYKEKEQSETEIANAEVIEIDNSNTLGIGSLIDLQVYENGDLLIDNVYIILDKGDSLIEGVISTGTELGKELLGKEVLGPLEIELDGIQYKVNKLSSVNIEQFENHHPTEDIFFSEMLKDVI